MCAAYAQSVCDSYVLVIVYSRLNRGIQSAAEMLPWKRGRGVAHSLTAPRVFLYTSLADAVVIFLLTLWFQSLRGVYSDTTLLNSTDPVEQRTAKSVVFLFVTPRPTNWVIATGSLRSLIGDSCSRGERVDNSTSSWVELCRYKHPLTGTTNLARVT